jgi:hypothetical protein
MPEHFVLDWPQKQWLAGQVLYDQQPSSWALLQADKLRLVVVVQMVSADWEHPCVLIMRKVLAGYAKLFVELV